MSSSKPPPIIALGVIVVGAKYGVKEYQNCKWENNPNTSEFNQLYRQCLSESIMSEVITTGSYVYLELSSKGLSIDEYNEWVEKSDNRRFR